MKLQNRVVDVVIGGATGLTATVVYIVVSRAGVSAGEWLQFAGIFLGVAATISGTLWLQRLTEVQQRRRQARNVADALDLVKKLLEALADRPHDEPIPRVSALGSAFSHVEWARNQLERCTYRVHAGLATLLDVWELEKEPLLEQAKLAVLYRTASADELISKAQYILQWTNGAIEVVMASDADERVWRENSPSV
jgi:hypothetical protein